MAEERQAVKIVLSSGKDPATGKDRISTVALNPGNPEVFVGRSQACGLRTPSDDMSVSSRHARLFLKKGEVWIEDAGSRNGIRCGMDTKRLTKPARLTSKNFFCIGSSVVRLAAAEGGAAKEKFFHPYHQLMFLEGNRRKCRIDIKPKADSTGNAFSVGSGPSMDFRLDDRTVSQRHASFSIHPDGDCYVRDRGSRNKTRVNGEELEVGRERLLQDNDEIALSYVRFRFLDRRFEHRRRHPFLQLLLLFIMVGIGAGIFFKEHVVGFVTSFIDRKSPAQYRAFALVAAKKERFDLAQEAVSNAMHGVGAWLDAQKYDNEALDEQVRNWRNAFEGWCEVRTKLQAGKTADPRSILDRILLKDDYWTWNDTSAKSAHCEAKFSADLIRRLNETSNLTGQSGADVATVSNAIAEINVYFSTNAAIFAERPYLAPATNNLAKLRAKLLQTFVNSEELVKVLRSVDKENPDFSEAVRRLERFLNETGRAAQLIQRAQAEDLLKICRLYVKTQAFLADERAALLDLDFDRVTRLAESLPLPERAASVSQPVFSDARAFYEKRHGEYQYVTKLLAPMVRGLAESGVGIGGEFGSDGDVGPTLKAVTAAKIWSRALSFDCFDARFPEPSRLEPTSDYDRLLGVELTYAILRDLPRTPGQYNAVRLKFLPLIQKARLVFGQAKTFRDVMARPEMASYRDGRLGALVGVADRVMAKRTTLVETLRKRSHEGAKPGEDLSRDRLVAGFAAEYFAEEPSYAELRVMETAFKQIERRLIELDERRDAEVDPEKRLGIAQEILKIGLPGNSVVRKVWIEKGNDD